MGILTKSAIEERDHSLRCGCNEPVRLHASARFRIVSRWQVAAFKAERMSLDCSECMLVRLSWKVLESYENNRRVNNECVGLVPCALPPPLGGLQVLLWSIERSNRCRTASHTPSHHVVRRMNIYADVMCGSTALVVRPSQSGKYCSPGPLLRALRGIVQPGFKTPLQVRSAPAAGGGSRGQPTASHSPGQTCD